MKKKAILALLCAMAVTAAGCSKGESKEEQLKEEVSVEKDMFSKRDSDATYDESQSIVITLDGETAVCDANAVNISGNKITLTEEGTYILRGTLEEGMLIVDAKDTDKLQVVLDNASITSSTSAALYVLEADKVFVTLAEGTENVLANGGAFEAIDDNNIDGAVFSKQDLTFNGTGNLLVESPADHGIVCKDDLVFTGGNYTVTSAGHGIDANDSLRYKEATLTVKAGKDGVHVENSDDVEKGFVYVESGELHLTAEGDGMDAGNTLQVLNGTVEILAGGGYENSTKTHSEGWGNFGGGMPGGFGGGRPGGGPGASRSSNQTEVSASSATEESTSMKGLKSTDDMSIHGGTIVVNAADDGLHSNASLTITGGILDIASGDDGIHAEDTLIVNDGEIQITESYEGLEALHIEVTGGKIQLMASDDGFNAAGGTDSSGMGGRDQMGGFGGPGGMSGNSDGTIVISGGDIYMQASGDGIDANGTLEITDGNIIVCGPASGDTTILDYDVSGSITGGTFIGTGSIFMAQTFSESTQGVFAVQCSCEGGSILTLTDSKGNEIVSYTPELDFTFICLSTPEMVSGESYTISVGGAEGTFEAQ